MQATIEIHKQFGLKKSLFDEVVDSVELMPGVREAFSSIRKWNTITVLISGGFKALADRVQRELNIDHSFCGCEYFWKPNGEIDHYNLLPSDEEAKAHFMQLVCIDYGVRARDCAFVGDGQNDVHLAKSVGFSVAFNAQPELKKVATVPIDQERGKEDFRAVVTTIANEFAGNRRFPIPWTLLFAIMGIRRKI
jgi:phosphoserine phosphatase